MHHHIRPRKGQSRAAGSQFRFLLRALAPWTVAAGVMVSFAAQAAYAPQTLDAPLSIIPDRLVAELSSEAERLGIEPAVEVPLIQRLVPRPPEDADGLLGMDDPRALPSSAFSVTRLASLERRFGRFALHGLDDTTPDAIGDRTAQDSGGASPKCSTGSLCRPRRGDASGRPRGRARFHDADAD